MSHRYERIDHGGDDEDLDVHANAVMPRAPHPVVPNSPPPSFRSRPSSPTPEANSALADSFDSPSDDDDDDDYDEADMRNHRSSSNANFSRESDPLVPASAAAAAARLSFARRPTAAAAATATAATAASSGTTPASAAAPSGPTIGGGQTDGVFANLSAKPSVGEKLEEHPPTYEQAAADATPPYWETTIMAPGMATDEVFIDGLPVGSVFAFIWNALVSMSFQLVGFLLTYLLHTTHAAKNGSRAGLGITLVQFGFMMRGRSDGDTPGTPPAETAPSEPNSYNFQGTPDAAAGAGSTEAVGRNEWLSYVLMVVGWFVLIRAVSDFLRARRTEQVVLASPDRGLGIAVVADNEPAEHSA